MDLQVIKQASTRIRPTCDDLIPASEVKFAAPAGDLTAMFAQVASAYGHGVATADIKSGDTKEWSDDEVQTVSRYVIELAACHQVKALSGKNITNYFKQYGQSVDGSGLLSLVNYVAAVLAPIASDADFADFIAESTYLRYHTSYSSTGELVAKAYDDLKAMAGGETKRFMSDGDYRAAVAARNSPWDKTLNSQISMRSKQITYLFLKSMKVLPDGWVQGEKAADEMSPILKKKYLAGFKKLAQIFSGEDDVDKANSLSEVLKCF